MTHEEVDREAATSPDTCKDCLHGLKDAWGKCGSYERKRAKMQMDIAPETPACKFFKDKKEEPKVTETPQHIKDKALEMLKSGKAIDYLIVMSTDMLPQVI